MKFNQPAYPTVVFSNQIWVKCPNCSEAALVSTTMPGFNAPYQFIYSSVCTCTSCSYHKTSEETWEGLIQGFVHRTCKHCGTAVFHSTEPTMKMRASDKVTCDNCHQTHEYELEWRKYTKDRTRDPYMGYELWQAGVKGNVLWVYNQEHLSYIRDYVSAKLRDVDGRHKYSLIANLPQWIKDAKNRDTVVKKLNKLEQQLSKIKPA